MRGKRYPCFVRYHGDRHENVSASEKEIKLVSICIALLRI